MAHRSPAPGWRNSGRRCRIVISLGRLGHETSAIRPSAVSIATIPARGPHAVSARQNDRSFSGKLGGELAGTSRSSALAFLPPARHAEGHGQANRQAREAAGSPTVLV